MSFFLSFYPSGAEPPAEDVVRLIASAGGVSVMAHPWTLTTGKGGHKGCYHLLQRLCAVGLLGLEVYKEPRTDSQRKTMISIRIMFSRVEMPLSNTKQDR